MLSPRLQAVLELIEPCKVLADIGTDHAYLPIEAYRAGLCEKAIASDINPGPLKIAESNIKAAGLSKKIETRLGDGLNPLNPGEADCIVITGMGGMRIIGILNEKTQNARLILQPQHDLEELRRNLHAKGYAIEEKLVREASRFYIIICAKKASNVKAWSDKEYFLGNLSGEFWQSYLQQKREKIERYIHSISDNAARIKAEQQLKWIEETL